MIGELEGPHGGRFHVNNEDGHHEGYTTLWGTTIKKPYWDKELVKDEPIRRALYRKLCGFDSVDYKALRRAVSMYYEMVSFVDACVGKVLDTLEQTGKISETIVVFTADHGDFAGERGLVVKCNSLVDALTRIPLIVRVAGDSQERGSIVREPVSLIDVMPTVACLAGVQPARGSRGQLLPGLGLDVVPRSAVFAEYGAGAALMALSDEPMAAREDSHRARPALRAAEAEGRPKMVRTRKWKYIYDPLDPVDELYDMESDPLELDNLAVKGDHGQTVTMMRRILLDWSITTEDSEPVPLFFSEGDFRSSDEPRPAPFVG